MTSVDINKWISGEIEAFSNPPTTPPLVAVDSDPGEERSAARPSTRKFPYPAIAAVVVACVFVALIAFIISARYPVVPPLAADVEPQPSEGKITSARTQDAAPLAPAAPAPTEIAPIAAPPILNQPTTHPDPQDAGFLSDVGTWHDQRPKAAPLPQKKPSPEQRTSSRHWTRYTPRVQAESSEATRLMVDELRQRGVAVGTASGSSRE